MIYDVEVTATAEKDLDGIIAYLLSCGQPQAAAAFLGEFGHKKTLIAGNPELYGFSRMPELFTRGYRTFLFQRYIALYRLMENRVLIDHVFHQRQDYASLI